jgi:glycosyltransferase involved in cell wall biosynthesis
MDHLQDRVACAKLFCPDKSYGRYRGLAIPLPGDPTQQLRLPSFFSVYRAIRDLKPDVLVIPTPGPYGLWGACVAKRLGVPICAGHHTRLGRLVELYWKGRLGSFAGTCLQSVSDLLFRYSDMVVANSDEMVESARGAGAPNVRLVGTPIAKCFLRSPPAFVSRKLRTVLYVGRLASEKNIDCVVDAAKRLPHVTFCIAGDGPQRRLVQRAATHLSNVRYEGWVARDQVVSLMDASDMLVLPSRVEAFGTVALEAMARRRLVLVSPRCGILDWEALSGSIFCMREDETLADAIDRIGRLSPESRREQAEAGHHAVQSLNECTMTEWIDVLAKLRKHG